MYNVRQKSYGNLTIREDRDLGERKGIHTATVKNFIKIYFKINWSLSGNMYAHYWIIGSNIQIIFLIILLITPVFNKLNIEYSPTLSYFDLIHITRQQASPLINQAKCLNVSLFVIVCHIVAVVVVVVILTKINP